MQRFELYRGGNRLLDALPSDVLAQLVPALDVRELRALEVTELSAADGDVLFPIDAILSTVSTLGDGRTCEIGSVGCEGAAGVDAAFGEAPRYLTLCHVSGRVVRLGNTAFRAAVASFPVFDELMFRACEAAKRFIEQQVACNALHTVQERCARRLLTIADRTRRDEFELTHDLLSAALGVRRPSVTTVAATLQRAGAIVARRGRIRIKSRARLRAAACECYATMQAVFEGSVTRWAHCA